MLPDAGAVPRTHMDGPPNLKLFPREVGPKAVDQKSTPLGRTQGTTERRVLVEWQMASRG